VAVASSKLEAGARGRRGPTDRARDLRALADSCFDLVVIGAGIAGACTAWDAALRGLRVALVERGDFGGATSSHSLKVAHGGIRYLQHLDLVRLRESCRERSAFLRIAPHLVRPMPFLVPTQGRGLGGRAAFRAALFALRTLTPDRNRGVSDPDRRIPDGGILQREELLARHPDLARRGFDGAGVFWDGQFLNPPRLVFSIVRSALEAGAAAANHCEATGLAVRAGAVEGVEVVDRLSGERFTIRARLVVNAAGPYAEELLVACGVLDRPRTPLSRDMAVVVPRNLVGDAGLALQTRYRDPDAILSRGNRHLFMTPWRHATLIGVHSRIFDGEPSRLCVGEAEVQGFLDEINEARPALDLALDDVSFVHAGLLPAGGSEADSNVSFGKRSVLVDHAQTGGPAGLVTIMSVRFTMGRAVAEAAVDHALRRLDRKPAPCQTAETSVHGGAIEGVARFVEDVVATRPSGIRADSARHLAEGFGSVWRSVLASAGADPSETVGDSPVLAAEIRHAVLHERAERLADVILRRTDLGTAGWPGDEVVEACGGILAGLLGWDARRLRAEIAAVREHYPPWQMCQTGQSDRRDDRAAELPGLELLERSAS
jgi:glycerol-3-phosphate dehydrogenase